MCIDRYGVPNFMSSEEGKKLTSLWHAKQTWRRVNDQSLDAVPLFTFDDVANKTPLTVFKWKCKRCGSVFESPIDFARARCGGKLARCLKCFPVPYKKSSKQCDVYSFVKSIYSGEVKLNDRALLHPYEIDIFLPELRVGIEFDGMYWHSAASGASQDALEFKTELCKQH